MDQIPRLGGAAGLYQQLVKAARSDQDHAQQLATEQVRFDERLAQCPAEHRDWWLAQYANPVISQLRQQAFLDSL